MILHIEAGIPALIAPDQADKQGIVFADNEKLSLLINSKSSICQTRYQPGVDGDIGVCIKVTNPWRKKIPTVRLDPE